ncbi:MAG: hypothetical protein O3B45_08985 [Bacteroidetes bacterium]|nr:hypothetical protein [Bacteroidota bacterium]
MKKGVGYEKGDPQSTLSRGAPSGLGVVERASGIASEDMADFDQLSPIRSFENDSIGTNVFSRCPVPIANQALMNSMKCAANQVPLSQLIRAIMTRLLGLVFVCDLRMVLT